MTDKTAQWKQLIPATDWFYVFRNEKKEPTVMHVAAFASDEEGSIVGLVGAPKPSVWYLRPELAAFTSTVTSLIPTNSFP